MERYNNAGSWESREQECPMGSTAQVGEAMTRALLLANCPSPCHRSPAPWDTRHLRQRRAPALGWLVAGLVSHRGRLKREKRDIPSADFLCREKHLIETGACAERGRG